MIKCYDSNYGIHEMNLKFTAVQATPNLASQRKRCCSFLIFRSILRGMVTTFFETFSMKWDVKLLFCAFSKVEIGL
ncbi:hypothetical protein T4D_7329 [Trichinella pseudospiralis]|uniref:Uncharacterized protein n=1 Tax=Trichinella pseudospiralis TaxID=6337 RepID=A0A0V1FQR3_TRIPS|nr:hypothetical protein T4D_7329 [Trichinella pseudospiralis]